MNCTQFALSIFGLFASASGPAWAHAELPGFREAARICQQHLSAEDEENCLARIWNKSFDLKALPTCDAHLQMANKEECLVAIADLRFAETVLDTCERHDEVADRQACLLRFGEPRGEGPSYQDLVVRMERAVRYLDRGRYGLARDLLWEALRAVEDGVPLP
jgi:hypothetical protein